MSKLTDWTIMDFFCWYNYRFQAKVARFFLSTRDGGRGSVCVWASVESESNHHAFHVPFVGGEKHFPKITYKHNVKIDRHYQHHWTIMDFFCWYNYRFPAKVARFFLCPRDGGRGSVRVYVS